MEQMMKKLTIQPLEVPIKYLITCRIFLWRKNADLSYFSATSTINKFETLLTKPTLCGTQQDIQDKIWQRISDTYAIEDIASEICIFYETINCNKKTMLNYGLGNY